MRNLYKQLKLPQDAPMPRIEARLNSISDRQLANDVEYVLLHDLRREEYDRHLNDLKEIAFHLNPCGTLQHVQ